MCVKNKKGMLELASFVCEEGIPVGRGWGGAGHGYPVSSRHSSLLNKWVGEISSKINSAMSCNSANIIGQ